MVKIGEDCVVAVALAYCTVCEGYVWVDEEGGIGV